MITDTRLSHAINRMPRSKLKHVLLMLGRDGVIDLQEEHVSVLTCKPEYFIKIIYGIETMSVCIPSDMTEAEADALADRLTKFMHDAAMSLSTVPMSSLSSLLKSSATISDTISTEPISVTRPSTLMVVDKDVGKLYKKISKELESRGDFEIDVVRLVDLLLQLNIVKAKEAHLEDSTDDI